MLMNMEPPDISQIFPRYFFVPHYEPFEAGEPEAILF